MRSRLSRMRQRGLWHHVLVAALLGLAIVALIFALAREPAKPQAPEPALVTRSTDTPSEQKPNTSTYRWQGAKNDPKFITIPGIAEGFMQRVGVDQHQAIAVPSNIHMAGWFVDSVRPGDKGLSIIDGHVDGPSQPGIFTRLSQAKVDTEFTITLGNGETKQFRITRVTSVAAKDAENELFSQDPSIIRQLNLITCGGNFDKTKRAYDKRVIVVSEFVQ